MIIHIVKQDETLSSIANHYKIPASLLIQENGITNPDNLVVGQTIIVAYPQSIYTIQDGDTLKGIADWHKISVMDLFRNNPWLCEQEYLLPGQKLVICYHCNRKSKITVSGYAFPFLTKTKLKKALPYLTYLNVFHYQITCSGKLIDIDDTEVIQMAKMYGVAPIMLISTQTEKGIGNREVVHCILDNQEIQDQLFENVLHTLKEKGYYGVNCYLQYISPEKRINYEIFVKRFADRVHAEGFRFQLSVMSNIHLEGTEITYEKMDYTSIAQTVDEILFLSCKWGYSFGPPVSTTPVNLLKGALDYRVKQIPPEKLSLEFPIIGYDWQLPYIPGDTIAHALTTDSVFKLASWYKIPIQYNTISQAPYFIYQPNVQESHIVWFKDVRSIDAITSLLPEYNIQRMSIWNIMYFYTQMWFFLNCNYEIEKILPILKP